MSLRGALLATLNQTPAAPTFRSSDTSTASPCNYPAGVTAGDGLHVLVTASTGEAGGATGAPNINTPSGYSLVTSCATVVGSTPNRVWYTTWLFTKTATGSEGSSLSVTEADGDTFIEQISIFCYVGGTASENATSTGTGASSTTMATVNVQSSASDRLGIHYAAYAGADTTFSSSTGETNGDLTSVATHGQHNLQTTALTGAVTCSGGTITLGASRQHRHRIGLAIHN